MFDVVVELVSPGVLRAYRDVVLAANAVDRGRTPPHEMRSVAQDGIPDVEVVA